MCVCVCVCVMSVNDKHMHKIIAGMSVFLLSPTSQRVQMTEWLVPSLSGGHTDVRPPPARRDTLPPLLNTDAAQRCIDIPRSAHIYFCC